MQLEPNQNPKAYPLSIAKKAPPVLTPAMIPNLNIPYPDYSKVLSYNYD